MGKKKIYAVAVGRTTGLFNTWEDTKKATDGVPNLHVRDRGHRCPLQAQPLGDCKLAREG